jgi:hypothetical protein
VVAVSFCEDAEQRPIFWREEGGLVDSRGRLSTSV